MWDLVKFQWSTYSRKCKVYCVMSLAFSGIAMVLVMTGGYKGITGSIVDTFIHIGMLVALLLSVIFGLYYSYLHGIYTYKHLEEVNRICIKHNMKTEGY